MQVDRKVLEEAIAALEDACGGRCNAEYNPCWQQEVAQTLKAALEQPEQEPVAWMVYTQDGKSVCVTDNPADFIEWRSFPLFTYPPRREWRGLTYQEIDDLQSGMQATFKDICAIEAALKEKNHE